MNIYTGQFRNVIRDPAAIKSISLLLCGSQNLTEECQPLITLTNPEGVDHSITIERCDNGDYRIVHNNGFKDYKYDTIYKNSGNIVEVRK